MFAPIRKSCGSREVTTLRAYVRFKLDSGETRELGPGDVIGRAWTAALPLADAFVSEAHALVSLREGALKLLGLRGRLSIGGKSVSEMTLSNGLRVGLSPRTTLEVVDVRVPSALLALDIPGLGRRPLTGVVSLVTQPGLQLIANASPGAAAVLWSNGLSWYAHLRDGSDQLLNPGETLTIDGVAIPIIAVSIGTSGEVTTADPASLESPLEITVRYDTVHIHRTGTPAITLDGMIARILSDLATAGVPVGWHVIARDLWPGESEVAVLRRNWDAAMSRLRKKLREARVRTDLVRTDHSGNFELFLARGDRVDDQT